MMLSKKKEYCELDNAMRRYNPRQPSSCVRMGSSCILLSRTLKSQEALLEQNSVSQFLID